MSFYCCHLPTQHVYAITIAVVPHGSYVASKLTRPNDSPINQLRKGNNTCNLPRWAECLTAGLSKAQQQVHFHLTSSSITQRKKKKNQSTKYIRWEMLEKTGK